MKVNEEMPKVYLEEYNINVNKYLTYGQIQEIVNNTENLLATTEGEDKKSNNTWGARKTNIDMLVLLLATDIGTENISEKSHTYFLQNGIIDAVNKSIANYNQLEEAFRYTESWDKILINCIQQLGKYFSSKEVTNNVVRALVGDKPNERNGD